MGILYNRFTPEPSFLPYSNPFKIVTYATSDNFDGSSSTWGTGSAPLVLNSGWWSKNSDGSVTFTSTNAYYPVSVNNIDTFTALTQAFTIYEVMRISSNITTSQQDYNTVIYRGNSSLGEINEQLFTPDAGPGQIGYSSRIGNWGYINHIDDLSVLSNYHITVAAYAHYHTEHEGTTEYHTDAELRYNNTINSQHRIVEPYLHHNIDNIQFAGRVWGTRAYKFIAIVKEKESSEVITNNMAFLKSYFGVEY